MNCPVCGHVDGACEGNVKTNTAQIITADGVVARTGPERVPRQNGRIGKPGYVGERTGKVQVYDPAFPNITLVAGLIVDDADAAPESQAVSSSPDPRGDRLQPATPQRAAALTHPVEVKPPRRPRKKAGE
jgi:hypothetical protein